MIELAISPVRYASFMASRLEVGEEIRYPFIAALREAKYRGIKLRELLDEVRRDGVNVTCDGRDGYIVKRWRKSSATPPEQHFLEAIGARTLR